MYTDHKVKDGFSASVGFPVATYDGFVVFEAASYEDLLEVRLSVRPQ